MKKLTKGQIALITIALVLIIDQVVKIYVKTHMYIGEAIRVTDWFYIAFIENNGMAFGMEIGSKLFLSLFRIVAVAVLVWILIRVKNKPHMPTGFMVCLALIIAGAAGNIIDSLFYGLLFNDPLPPAVASFVPGEGYAGLFYGRVVDMLYFPLFSFYWPDWIPWIGGERFEFFRPVFNIADSAISVGVVCMILFYHRCLSSDNKKKTDTPQ